jgi:hypothetical protein
MGNIRLLFIDSDLLYEVSFRYKGGSHSYKTNMAIHGEDLVSS